MLDVRNCVEFSVNDLELIESALHTQEKILSVQARAGGNAAKIRLNELRSVLRRVRSQNPQSAQTTCTARSSWGSFTRALFG